MASTKEYLGFILEQLSELDEVSFRAMMGEYILYYRGKVFGGIYDDRLLIKPVPATVKMMPDATMELMKENLRLRKELEEAKKENLFLKKAAAFFAKEID